VVEPAFPTALTRADHQRDFGRIAPAQRRARLAQWLTSPDNPLTARVLVNRVWAWHFGEGLVRTPGDFGFQGEEPTHPKLLDWLANDLIAHGWSLKRLHRLILTSSTYRMASVATGAGLKADPENRLLWHFPRRRLEGEAIRDAMLACGGRLNPKLFGPSVVPPMGKEELTGLFDAKGKWPITKDAREHDRRGVYLLIRRTFIYPLFATFDPPEVMTSCPRRMRTIVPTQALALFNSPLARSQAAVFAHRLLADCGGEPERRVDRAWLLAFSRPVTAGERDHALAFLKSRTAALRGRQNSARPFSICEVALADLCLALFNANEFIYVD
jgi:hypothetical protein